MNDHQDLAICALNRMADHLLYEKCKAFQLNPQQPEGKDPKSVIEDYLNQDQRIMSAIAWVKAQNPTLDLPMEDHPWTDEQRLQLTRGRYWLHEIWKQLLGAIRLASPVLCDEDHIKEFIANMAQRLLINHADPHATAEMRWRIDRLIIHELSEVFPPPTLLSPTPRITTH